MTTLGARIREVRERKGLTQTQLAKLAGCGQSLIGNLESEKRFSTSYLLKIAAALGVSPHWLEDGTGEADGIVSPANLVTPGADTHSSLNGLPRQHGGKQQGTQTTDADRTSISGEKPPFWGYSQGNSTPRPGHHTSHGSGTVPLVDFERLSMSIDVAIQESAKRIDFGGAAPEGAFCFYIPDDTHAPRIAKGAMVVVDPKARPVIGSSIVLAAYGGGRPVFRRIFEDGPRVYLRTINAPAVQDEQTPEWKVLGVVRFISEVLPVLEDEGAKDAQAPTEEP